jgi:hypothetical protein
MKKISFTYKINLKALKWAIMFMTCFELIGEVLPYFLDFVIFPSFFSQSTILFLLRVVHLKVSNANGKGQVCSTSLTHISQTCGSGLSAPFSSSMCGPLVGFGDE